MASVAKRKWVYQGKEREAWVVRYKDRGGAHRSKQFDRKKEADAYCRTVENELEAGSHVVPTKSRTVADLIDEYCTIADSKVAAGERARSGTDAGRRSLNYFKPYIGAILARDLTWQQVEDAVQKIKHRRSHMKRKIAPGTLRHAVTKLSTVVGYGVRRGYAARNVVSDAMREIGAINSQAIERFTQDELRQLLRVIEIPTFKQPKHAIAMMRLVVYLGAFCGLRRGEIFGLTNEAIDLERRIVSIRVALNEFDQLGTPKTPASVREVPLPSIVLQALEAYRPHMRPDDRGLIIRGHRGGNVLDGNNFYKRWHPLLERAGMPAGDRGWKHFHALRHFAGSSWLQAGVPLPEVSRMLGHANPSITARIYSYALVEAHHRAPLMEQAVSLVAPYPALAARPDYATVAHSLVSA